MALGPVYNKRPRNIPSFFDCGAGPQRLPSRNVTLQRFGSWVLHLALRGMSRRRVWDWAIKFTVFTAKRKERRKARTKTRKETIKFTL